VTALQLEPFNFEKAQPLCKDLSANPCREMLVDGLCPSYNKHFKRKRLYFANPGGGSSCRACFMPPPSV
jgi:hypothetical protein